MIYPYFVDGAVLNWLVGFALSGSALLLLESMKKIRASHILVKHQYEAEDILRALQEGKDFEGLARKYSTRSSSADGEIWEFLRWAEWMKLSRKRRFLF